MNGFVREFSRFRSLGAQMVAAALVATVVSSWHTAHLGSQAHAEPRRITATEPDQHFKSGGRLSETVLQEMLVVLKRIDERLERMEKVVDQSSGSTRVPTTGATPGEDQQIQVRRSR